MKKNLVLATCLLAATAAVYWSIGVSGQKATGDESSRTETAAAPQAIIVEDFSYSTGALTLAGGANTSGGNWVNFSGTGNFIPVSSGSLSYTGYPSSGIGNKIDIISVASSAEDAHRQFATQGVGTTTYAAFMVNVANTTGLLLNTSTTGDYFAGFLPSTSTTLLNARVSIRQGAVSGFNFGLRATSANTTTSFAAADLATGTTHLVVISYQVVAGDSNDVVRMWINPVITGPEPAADLTQTTASVTDIGEISRFFVRQAATTTPNASLDGVRVSSNWAGLITAQPQQNYIDMNGDGKTDYSVGRNTGGGPTGQRTWFTQYNGVAGTQTDAWGISTDFFVPGNYDGDNKTDVAVWRPGAPGIAAWYILQSATSTVRAEPFGQTGDDPTMVGDYNGDGHDDLAVYRAGAASGDPSTWFYRTTANGPVFYVPWGQNGDFPAPGDYDGNGSNDFVIQRNNGGGQAAFWTRLSTGATSVTVFGTPTDVIVPGDYDGDGKTDIAVRRGAAGQLNWSVLPSSGGPFTSTVFGLSATDFTAQGDYDGDGKTDIAVWRPNADPSQNFFYVLGSTSGFTAFEWGQNGDYPVANYNAH